MNISNVLCVGLLSLGLVGCAQRAATPTGAGPDPKLTLSSYIEDGKLAALVVGTRVAQIRDDRSYMPLEVAIVNKGLEGLSLTGESFTLVDENGTRYPAVEHRELTREYGDIDVDRRLAELPDAISGQYGSYARVRSTLTTSFDKPIAETLRIPRFSYAVDFLYFAKPETGVRGHRFELFMSAPELEDPIFVQFAVKGRADGKS